LEINHYTKEEEMVLRKIVVKVTRNPYLEKWSLENCKEIIPRFISPKVKEGDHH
jgi:hypothetical protein